jgi:hypothetical protein
LKRYLDKLFEIVSTVLLESSSLSSHLVFGAADFFLGGNEAFKLTPLTTVALALGLCSSSSSSSSSDSSILFFGAFFFLGFSSSSSDSSIFLVEIEFLIDSVEKVKSSGKEKLGT